MKKIKEIMPSTIKPMLATLVDNPPIGKDWIYEIKWDGYRAIAICNKDQVNLISRNNKSFNEKFYPIFQALKKMKLNAVLDGEIVVINQSGIANFSDLQNWRSEADGELIFYVFDILWLNGVSLLEYPLSNRKELLNKIISLKGIIRQSKPFNISGIKFFKAISEMGLEGMIAKRKESLYIQGFRSKEWLKIKTSNRHEVIIGGYTLNENSPKKFSALLVGVFENGSFEYRGKVGTGFNDKTQGKMISQFKELETKKCPFTVMPDINKPSRFRPNPPHATAVWLQPKLVCEVSYTEMTSDGVMRHPSFKGMREDKNAEDLNIENTVKTEKVVKKAPLKILKASKFERQTLLNPNEEAQVKIIKGHELKFNHLSKVFWPDDGYTKRDLLNYYYQVAPYILPYLMDRPQSLNRFPNGIEGLSFYQKDVSNSAPEWVKKFPYVTSLNEHKNFIVVQDEADLLWMANLGAIEMNPWNSTIKKPDHPDWCIIDIDPTDKNSFDDVITVALETKKVLDALKIKGYCKTSGATGMHIYIPLDAKYTYDQCQLFGRMIATEVHLALPKLTSIERYTVNRKKQIYVDFLQNRPKATLASPYSVRPKPHATVSTPLHWDEVKKGLMPQQFTIKNVIQRIKSEGDLFKPVLEKGINLEKIIKMLQK